MIFDSLRDFLAALDDNGQLLRITNEVAPEPDLGAAGRAANDLGENAPALLFENILGFEDARVALNVHGSWPNNALMLGLDKNTPVKAQFFEFVRRYRTFPCAVERRHAAPWQECVGRRVASRTYWDGGQSRNVLDQKAVSALSPVLLR
jgi:vanillate/4-hydroxybenzoate decarboxylase subunit C